MKPWVKAALGTAAATAPLLIFNGWAGWNVGPVPRWVSGEPHFYQWREGAIYYEAAGPAGGPPLLLVHGFNAAASHYEMRRIFAPLAGHFRVYLPDLLGYGRSERPGIRYSAETYVDLWTDFVRDVAGGGAGRPVHVVASSLSAAHLVAAAARHPQRYGSLLLVCPTGITSLADRPGPAQVALQSLLRSPLLGTAIFNALVTRPSLAAFLLRQAYADPGRVTAEVVGDYYTTSHQPGSKWAPSAFVAGELNCSIGPALAALPNAIHLGWGRHATITPLAEAEGFRARRPDATLAIFEHSGLLPHDEEPDRFVEWVNRVLS